MKQLVALALLLAAFSYQLEATTRYVSKTGNDSNACSTTDSAGTNKLTIRAGIGCMAAGDTLYIHTGTYAENIWSYTFGGTTKTNFPTGGSSYAVGQVTTISAFTGQVVTLQGGFDIRGSDFTSVTEPNYFILQNIIIDGSTGASGTDGFTLRPDASGRNVDHWKLIGLEIKNCKRNGIQLATDVGNGAAAANTYFELTNLLVHNNGGTDFHNHGIYVQTSFNTIDGGSYYSNAGWGLHFYTNTTNPRITDNTLKNFTAYSNGVSSGTGCGFILSNGDRNLAYNFIVYSNATDGWQVTYDCDNCKIYNGVAYGNLRYGGLIGEFGATSTGTLVKNNIFLSNVSNPIRIFGNSNSAVVQFNDFFGNGGGNTVTDGGVTSTVSSNITTDPQVISTSTKDFHIPTGSPCKNAGTSLVGVVDTDKDGNARPFGASWDIGAYEYNTPDVTAPVISAVTATPTDVTAIITWTTNEAADSQVEYGPTTSYGLSTTLDTTLVLSHSVSLSSLSAGTLYHYRVKSADSSANQATGTDNNFTTSGTPFTSTITLLTPNGGERIQNGIGSLISWESDDPGNLKVEYSDNNGGTYQTISASVAASAGQLAWTVPIGATSVALVKITSLLDPLVIDTSAANFKVYGIYWK